MRLRSAFVAVTGMALFFLSACAPGSRALKAYDGPERPAAEVSVIQEDKDRRLGLAILLTVDDAQIETATGSMGIGPAAVTEVKVLPGFHQLTVRCQQESNQMRYWKDFPTDVIVKAGHSYLVSCRIERVFVEEQGSGEFIAGYKSDNVQPYGIKFGSCTPKECTHDEYELRGQRESASWFKRVCNSGKGCGAWKDVGQSNPALYVGR